MYKNFFDTGEIQVYRHGQGIKLVKPKTKKNQSEQSNFNLLDLFNLPFSIFFLDFESRLQMGNKTLLELMNVNSLKEVIGPLCQHSCRLYL
jgi:hypothetical protein